jgi:hypothetical protein
MVALQAFERLRHDDRGRLCLRHIKLKTISWRSN